MIAKNRHYWLKSGSYALSTNMLNLIFGFGSFYLLVRILDKHSYGVWALFVATTTIIEMARNGLVQNALVRYLSSSSETDYSKIISASFILTGLVVIACIILNTSMAEWLATLWHYPGLSKMFYTYNLVYILLALVSQLQFIEQANMSFRGIFVSNAVRLGSFFGFVLFCLLAHVQVSLIMLIYVQAICAVIATLIEYFFVRRYLAFSKSPGTQWVIKLFHYGKYVVGTSLGSVLTNTINQMMLGALLSPEAAGALNVAVRITNLTDLPSNTLGTIVFPQSAKRFVSGGNEPIKYLYEKSVGSILALLIPSLLILLLIPGFIVHLIAGGNYPETIPVLRVTVFICLITPYTRMFGTILDSMGKPQISFYMNLLFAFLEIVLNYFLIREFGILGAVYATLIADIIFFLAIQIILYRELKVNCLNAFIYAVRFYPEILTNFFAPAGIRRNQVKDE